MRLPKKLQECLLTKLTKKEAEQLIEDIDFSYVLFIDAVKDILYKRGDLGEDNTKKATLQI